jgi:long-chain acyl-CoA synthetase
VSEVDLGESLLDILTSSARRYAAEPAMSIRLDDGSTETWTYSELERRAKLAAWRLRALGLQRGDRLMTWASAGPHLPAVYFGAMYAGVVLVPVDLHMAPDAIERIAQRADARLLALGGGREAPDPREAGLADFPRTSLEGLSAPQTEGYATAPGDGAARAELPAGWEAEVDRMPRPKADDIYELLYTSGTTGTPKGAILSHRNLLTSVINCHKVIPPYRHRLVSLLPLSHVFEQLAGLFYALSLGFSVTYVRSRNPRVIFEAMRSARVTAMMLVPQVHELFYQAILHEVEKRGKLAAFERLRRIARLLPLPLRRLLFRSVHQQFGGGVRLFVSAAAFLPPAIQQAWEDMGVVLIQGYGATECGLATATTPQDHGLGTVGRPVPPTEVRLAADGEVEVRGGNVFVGYWRDDAATAAAKSADGWYHTGDIGRFDERGNLILMGRKKDMIALPNGMKVYPEDMENALRVAGVRDSVVVETEPGRIEAVVLAPGTPPIPQGGAASLSAALEPQVVRDQIEASVARANERLGQYQRIRAWKLWPEDDFPRTHTLKVRRDLVRNWAVAAASPVGPAAMPTAAGGA